MDAVSTTSIKVEKVHRTSNTEVRELDIDEIPGGSDSDKIAYCKVPLSEG